MPFLLRFGVAPSFVDLSDTVQWWWGTRVRHGRGKSWYGSGCIPG